MIFKIALGVLFLTWFIWAFARGVKRARWAKRECRASMNKWLLEKADECDLKAEDDTKVCPLGGMV